MRTNLTNQFVRQLSFVTVVAGLTVTAPITFAEAAAPCGKGREVVADYPAMSVVFDVYCHKPAQLADVASDLEAINTVMKGRIVAVIRGAGVAAFARKNYSQHHTTIDHLARLAKQGVQYRLDSNTVQAAGFEPSDMHGFATVVSHGLAEIAAQQERGSRYVQFTPHQHDATADQQIGGARDNEQSGQESGLQFSM